MDTWSGAPSLTALQVHFLSLRLPCMGPRGRVGHWISASPLQHHTFVLLLPCFRTHQPRHRLIDATKEDDRLRPSVLLTKGTRNGAAFSSPSSRRSGPIGYYSGSPGQPDTSKRSDIACRSNAPNIFCAGILGPWLDVQ